MSNDTNDMRKKLKPYTANFDVTNCGGYQTFQVLAYCEAEALTMLKAGEGILVDHEVDVTSTVLDEDSISEQEAESSEHCCESCRLKDNEIDQLKSRVAELESDAKRYESLINNGLICNECGSIGIVGNPPDDYYDCPSCAKKGNKFESDVIRKFMHKNSIFIDRNTWAAFEEYADKVEQGEL